MCNKNKVLYNIQRTRLITLIAQATKALRQSTDVKYGFYLAQTIKRLKDKLHNLSF